MNKPKQAFTFIELIVSSLILVIVSMAWFYSYVWYLTEARDWERKTNASSISSWLKIYKQSRWSYPFPWDYYNLTNSWITVAYQWRFNKDVSLTELYSFPYDPYTKEPYFYSITSNKQEFQLGITLENWDFPIAYVGWDYHTVSKNVLPSILLALDLSWDTEINNSIPPWDINRDYFILNSWKNLPYTIYPPYFPYFEGVTLDEVLQDWWINFLQNSNFSICKDISDSKKSIWDWQYQLLDETTGLLWNVNCKTCSWSLIEESETCN